MGHCDEEDVWRNKGGLASRIGSGAEVAWIVEQTNRQGVTYAIPPVFEAYAIGRASIHERERCPRVP
jgi:hypothetical protein